MFQLLALLLQRFTELGGVLLGVQHLDGLADAETVLQKHAEGVRAKGVLGGEHAVAVLHAVGQHEPVLLVEADLRLGHAGHGGELLHPVHGLPPQRCWWMNFYDSSFPRERAAQEKPRAWKTPAD